MALVEKFHIVAAEQDVASGETIKEGQVVSLNSSGEVVLVSSNSTIPYGIAGDTKSDTASALPGVDSSTVISGNGGTGNFQNRVSDSFNETRASGKMTVYHSGGEFATDQFASNVSSATINDLLFANASGVLDTVDASGGTNEFMRVARLTRAAGTFPSGVPGIDINGDQALSGENSNTYIEFKLII